MDLKAATMRQLAKKLAQKIGEELQLVGTSSPTPDDGTHHARLNIESGGGTSTSMTTMPSIRFQIIATVSGNNEVSMKLIKRLEPNLVLPGSKVLYKRFEVNPRDPEDRQNVISQIVNSMTEAHNVDKDCSLQLQLGSSAVFKYTGI